jgi:hypothetical protein
VSGERQTAANAGLPFTALDGFVADPRMFHYLPLRAALELRVLPMTLIGDRLQVAAATATPDLVALRRHYPNLQVDLVVAPAEAIDRVLAHAEGTTA